MKLIDIPITRALVTFGPTDEGIDDVMKITNMSTGRLGVEIAEALTVAYGSSLELWMLGNKTAYRINSEAIESLENAGAKYEAIGGLKNGSYVTKETDDLLEVLGDVMGKNRIDYVFHTAAVGDYTGRFATSNKLLAKEIMELSEKMGGKLTETAVAELLSAPKNVFDQDTKMSSDEPNMIVGLGLTPKVIASINGFAQAAGYETKLISWKLLSDVPEDELYNVALQHGRRNGSWRVVANDLSRIGDGAHWAMVIDVERETTQELFDKDGIARYLTEISLPEALGEMLGRCKEIGFEFSADVSYKYLLSDDESIIGVLGIEKDNAMFHLLKEYQGQGLGRAAIDLILESGLSLYANSAWGNKEAFEKYGLHVTGHSEKHNCDIMKK